MNDEILVSLVIQSLRAKKFMIASEAAWVLTNALTLCYIEDLKTFVRVYSEDLVHSICHMLERCNLQNSDSRVTNEVLRTLTRLLSLDKECEDGEFSGENSVAVMVAECDGFEIIQSMQMSE